jgi:hypothetical protein
VYTATGGLMRYEVSDSALRYHAIKTSSPRLSLDRVDRRLLVNKGYGNKFLSLSLVYFTKS